MNKLFEKIQNFIQIIKNMGLRYVFYRIWFGFRKKSGLLKLDFPTNPSKKKWISLADWKKTESKFFFKNKETLKFDKNPSPILKTNYEKIQKGIFSYFSSTDFHLGKNYNWFSNPDNNYRYPLKHWTDIPDFSKETGDIKYVWEKSRFSFLYTIIRYDYHFNSDQSKLVFDEIQSWINANPVNLGPNWRCSQEISLRVLNWTFALNYYKNSENLTEEVFQEIQNSIYWQIRHVYSNINFSRIAVRNNHAITETLALYLVGLLYPHFEETLNWKTKGKAWFEQEIAYQIYDDGTFLQFSMNYHRVVIQLLTWACYLSEINGDMFSEIVYDRAQKSLEFLMACQDEKTGQLPNYGANDGALFFPLNNLEYRDYRGQLNPLYFYLNKKNYNQTVELLEDTFWFTKNRNLEKGISIKNEATPRSTGKGLGRSEDSVRSFPIGGYYLIKEENSSTFIRCGNHKDRPSQADNLHLDIWVNGINILRDAGSYKYNTDEETNRFFNGTASHNTIMLGENDQMKKGQRFIWYHWSLVKTANIFVKEEYFEFVGEIEAFKYLKKGINHKRIVRKYKNKLSWEIIDEISDNCGLPMIQIWNPNEEFFDKYSIKSIDKSGAEIVPNLQKGWYSTYYGIKEETKQIKFFSETNKIITIIESLPH